jgi:putative membrane protein
VTPRQQMRDEVSLRAQSLFFDQRVHHTAGRSGLLLYVSLYEHMSAVIADQAATEVLGQQRLERICGELTDRLRSSDPATALCETIASLSAELASALPRDAQDVNELSDALVIAD